MKRDMLKRTAVVGKVWSGVEWACVGLGKRLPTPFFSFLLFLSPPFQRGLWMIGSGYRIFHHLIMTLFYVYRAIS